MYRNTYVEINEDILENNIKDIVSKYPYKYYFGVVKGNAYGHGMHIVNSIINGGINYIAVATLEEALDVRKYNKDIPILCFGYIDCKYLDILEKNNITLTITSYNHFNEFINYNCKVKIHIKLNTGMNRLGIDDKNKLKEIIDICKEKNINLEGIYTHYATSGVLDKYWDLQTKKFEELTSLIDLNEIPIVHGYDSLALAKHQKKSYYNGVRLGIVMYGYSSSVKEPVGFKKTVYELKKTIKLQGTKVSITKFSNNLKLNKAFNVYSEVINISKINPGDTVGYHAKYIAKEKETIATISIGYADGITSNFKYVKINNKKYSIVAFSMDYIMVKVDDKVKIHDIVTIIDNDITMNSIAINSGINISNALVNISSRIPRVHIYKDKKEEIKY